MITKQQAINLFGGRAVDLARALGKGKSAISQWPDELDEDKTNMVIGSATRKGIPIPPDIFSSHGDE